MFEELGFSTLTAPQAAVGFAALLGLATTMGSADTALGTDNAVTETAAAASPLEGRWSLDLSRIPAEERPQNVSIDFARLTCSLRILDLFSRFFISS